MRASSLLAAISALAASSFAALPVVPRSLIAGTGRGKGRTKTHNRGGVRANQRAAAKARNVKRYRASLKG
jgi:hypothetical protein